MKARNVPARALLWWMLCVSSPLLAASGVTRWENTFRRPLAGAGYQSVFAARELADGTTLVVTQDNYGLTTLRYDHSGIQLAEASFYPVYLGYSRFVSIDPFGAVFFVSGIPNDFGDSVDVWMTKYDGLTGAALWPSAVTLGGGNHADDAPLAILVDGAGDVVLRWSSSVSGLLVSKFSGRNGQPIWGPVNTGISSSVGEIDSAGDLYVAGHDGGGVGATFYLTKYSGATGSVVWRVVEQGHDLKPVSVGVDGSGDVVVSGGATTSAGSFEADKYSGATGQRIWGPAIWTPPSGNYSTAADQAAVGSDGSVVIFGHTFANNEASEELLKFRGADGALLWGPVPNTDPAESPYGSTLALAGNGDVVLSAQVQTGQSSSDAKMWRYDGNTGNLVWGPEVTVNGAVGSTFVASNGRVFVGLGVFNGTDEDAVVLERDGATGAPAWGPTSFTGVGGGYAYLWDLTAASDGNAVVTGQVIGADGYGSWATLKYDRATGATRWGPVYFPDSLPPAYSPWRVLTDSAGDVLVGGTTSGGMAVVKYAGATGEQLWTATIAIGPNVTAFALDPSGNAVIAGYNESATGYDAVTAKISGANGTTMWGPLTYDSGSDDFADFVAADPSGNVVLGGHSIGVLGSNGFLVEYAAADGSTVWGPTTQADNPSWLAIDAAGDVLRESCCSGITTTKYSGASGATLWGPITVGVPSDAYGTALALDAAGDVLVTGSLYNGQTYDYAVIKCRGSDGAVLWGPVTWDSGTSDSPYGIVVDGSGNAVVTGTSRDGAAELRSATLSFDGATGGLRWGPVGRNIARDSVNGLAASGSTVYVGATRGDLGYIVDAIDESLGIVAIQEDVTAASCGHLVDVPLGGLNGTPPYTWSVPSGALPPGVALGSDGHLSGPPSQEGVFSFTARVQDTSLGSASRDFTMVVGPGSDLVPVSVARDPATCELTLSVPGSYAGYSWQPGGETTPTIQVDPTEPTTYGVLLDDGTSCHLRGAVTITPRDPSCLAPAVASIAPPSGPSSGTPVVVTGSKFDAAAALSIGGLPATGVVFDSSSALSANTPALSPGAVADVLVANPDGRYGFLPRGFAADYLDVTSSNPFYADIMRVLRAGITAGCGGGNYCPNGSVTRAQMAVFLLKAEHGFFYVPPACTGIFGDVACPAGFAVDWIERLSSEGITGGCGGGNYCPDAVVTRAQMSAFLLKAEHGSSYMPPPCAGIFGDVPCGSQFADWIEQLFNEGITGGCGNGNYCPSNPNTRAQMAVFLSKTFSLP